MELLKVTRDIAIRAILWGACDKVKIGTLVSEFSFRDLVWAERIFTPIELKKFKLPIWVWCKSAFGNGDGEGYGSASGYVGGYGDGFGWGHDSEYGCSYGYGNGLGDGYGHGYGYGYGVTYSTNNYGSGSGDYGGALFDGSGCGSVFPDENGIWSKCGDGQGADITSKILALERT